MLHGYHDLSQGAHKEQVEGGRTRERDNTFRKHSFWEQLGIKINRSSSKDVSS